MTIDLNSRDAAIRAARYRRVRAIQRFWSKLADDLSPRLPKILQQDD